MTASARPEIPAASPRVELHVVSIADALEPRRAKPWQDPDEIATIAPEKLRAMRTNPFSAGRDDPAQVVATVDGLVAGRIDVLPGCVKVEGERAPCLSASSLYVAPAFRDLGIGAMLLLRLQQLHHTVVACGVSQQAYPLYVKLRWHDLPLKRYVLVRRSRPLLERYAPGPASVAVGTVLGDAFLAALRALAASPRTAKLRRLSCERVESLPNSLDDDLERVEEPAAFDRSAAWLNWILTNSFEIDPRNRRGLFLVRDGRGRLVGYFLIISRFHAKASRRELPNLLLGSLQDWMILDRTALGTEQLILLAIRELSRWRVDAVEVCLGENDDVPRLWRWGFRQVEDLHLLVRAAPGSSLRGPPFSAPPAWRLRPGDGDNAL